MLNWLNVVKGIRILQEYKKDLEIDTDTTFLFAVYDGPVKPADREKLKNLGWSEPEEHGLVCWHMPNFDEEEKEEEDEPDVGEDEDEDDLENAHEDEDDEDDDSDEDEELEDE